MTTIVNTPTTPTESGGTGMMIGFTIFAVVVIVFLMFGLPAIRRMGPVQVNVPAQVNIPSEIEVNVTKP